jgi:hypothetical protein
LVYFMAIWYTLWPFGICFFILVCCNKNNLTTLSISHQGCQMVYFQTKNHNLGKFWCPLELKMLKYFKAIWSIFRTFGIFSRRLGYFMTIWYILCT